MHTRVFVPLVLSPPVSTDVHSFVHYPQKLSSTIDILNDLLCINKLESGIMTMHRSENNVVDFVEHAVRIGSCFLRR